MKYANILIECYSIIISVILALYLGCHRKNMRVQKNWFIVMLISNVGMSLGDMTDWILSMYAIPYSDIILTIGMVVLFSSSGMLMFSFTCYLLAYLGRDIKNPAGIISGLMGGIQILAAILSPFTNGALLFDLGPDGGYQRGDLFFISQITAGLSYVVHLFLIARGRRKMVKREVIFLSSFIILPIIGEFIQVFFYDIAMLSVGATLSMLLVFINVQSSQEMRIEKAEAMAQAKTDFLASMSHEIRTPINAVLGMNEIIIRETGEQNILEYAENIESAGKKLLAIINDILDFSKLESQKMEIVPAPYQLSSLVHDLYNMIADRVEKKGLSLRIRVSPDIPDNLQGDEVRINQIVLNLLTNAVKYTQKGYVELAVGYVEREEDILLRIEVKDTGSGIRKDDIGRLFDSFQRLEEKKNRAIEGTGLGLSIVKNLVDLMDGEITVHSIYGKGSEFAVLIPQQVLSKEPIGDYQERVKNKSSEADLKQAAFVAPEARILAVDDNRMNLKVLQGLLKRVQVKLDMAESGEEAIRKLQENRYDLILLDHRMPHMDGIETLQIMKEKNLLHGIPVIALTANAVSGAKETYIQNGFQDYLAKPIAGNRLEEMLAQWLPDEKMKKREETIVHPAKRAEKLIQELRHLLDIGQAMEYAGNDTEGLAMNLMFFCENASVLDDSLSADFTKKDYESYGIHAHALKSNAATIGAVGLSEMARELEFACKEQNPGKVEEKHEIMMESYRSLVKYLKERGI